jgi:hypothetical protein
VQEETAVAPYPQSPHPSLCCRESPCCGLCRRCWKGKAKNTSERPRLAQSLVAWRSRASITRRRLEFSIDQYIPRHRNDECRSRPAISSLPSTAISSLSNSSSQRIHHNQWTSIEAYWINNSPERVLQKTPSHSMDLYGASRWCYVGELYLPLDRSSRNACTWIARGQNTYGRSHQED